MMNQFKRAIVDAGCSFDDYLIESSAVLALYGLRDAYDIDYITAREDRLPKSEFFENHASAYPRTVSLDVLLYDPRYYLYFLGVKFASLEQVEHAKSLRGEKKDKRDVKLIADVRRMKLKGMRWRNISRYREGMRRFLFRMRTRLVQRLKNDGNVYAVLRKIYRTLMKSGS